MTFGSRRDDWMTTTDSAAVNPPTMDEDLWFDEVVERSDDWMVVSVTTPRGKRVLYRIMIKTPA